MTQTSSTSPSAPVPPAVPASPRPALCVFAAPAEPDSDLPVLARLPDFLAQPEPESAAVTIPMPTRIVGQAWAARLLIGGGVLLALAAIVSFLGNRRAPPPAGTVEGDHWRPASVRAPQSPGRSDLPAAPAVAAPAGAPQSNGVATMPGGGAVGAPRRPPTADSNANAPMSLGPPAAAPLPTIYPTARGSAGGAPPNPRPPASPPADGSSALPAAAPSSAPPTVEPLADRRMVPPPSGDTEWEPGTARLEGVIERPSLRTTFDGPRSNVHY